MKPRLSVPLTSEDRVIWWHHVWSSSEYPLRDLCRDADRRDAELMHWLSVTTVTHYAGLPQECFIPVAHLWIRIDPQWPAGHHGWVFA